MISVIIPHKNRNGILQETLQRLHNRQTVRRDLFEIIVVDDGSDILPFAQEWGADILLHNEGKGPGEARNTGTATATYDTVLFLGNDTIPDRNLIFRHIYQHKLANNPRVTVQGYTPFHPQVMDTEFMYFLDRSGLQANWGSLRNEDGSWKNDATGYLLTTNWSINRFELMLAGGFSPHLQKAAWDDVELGMRLQKLGFKTIFDPLALNFHYHKYDLPTFANRQFMEGSQRIHFAMEHPEVSSSLIDPEALRQIKNIDLDERVHAAQQLSRVASHRLSVQYDGFQESRNQMWNDTLRLASLKGIASSLDSQLKQVLFHLHTPKQIVYAVSAMQACRNEDWGYAAHGAEWLIEAAKDNWAIWAFGGDVANLIGDKELAQMRFNKSMNIAPSDWARKGLKNGR